MSKDTLFEERERLYSLAYNSGLLWCAIQAVKDTCFSTEDPRAPEWERRTRAAHKALMEVWMEANPAACGSSPDEEDQG